MRKLRKYLTGYLAGDWEFYPPAPYRGKGWNITFEETPRSGKSGISYGDKTSTDREVTINAPSFKTAQEALGILNGALCLILGAPLLFEEIEVVQPYDKKERQELFPQDSLIGFDFSKTIGTSRIPRACMIAVKASHRKAYKYALGKIKFASDLHSLQMVDSDPSHATQHFGVTHYTKDLVNFAYSIIASYSAIEELGLEIRTKGKPSTKKGKWTPEVKQSLEQRLRKSGINLNDTVPWALRGKPTEIEKAKILPSKGKCEWARGPYVRDCELELIDAIRIASWLRSKVAAHRFGGITGSLNSYDVDNVRHLARRLLFERLGFWRKHFY